MYRLQVESMSETFCVAQGERRMTRVTRNTKSPQ